MTDLDIWLRTIAETCILHMKFIEAMEVSKPESLTTEDYGVLELERGFLTLYSLHTTGELPPTDG